MATHTGVFLVCLCWVQGHVFQ